MRSSHLENRVLKPKAYFGLSFHLYAVIHFFRMKPTQKSSPATCMESSPTGLQCIVHYHKRDNLQSCEYVLAVDFAIFSAILQTASSSEQHGRSRRLTIHIYIYPTYNMKSTETVQYIGYSGYIYNMKSTGTSAQDAQTTGKSNKMAIV